MHITRAIAIIGLVLSLGLWLGALAPAEPTAQAVELRPLIIIATPAPAIPTPALQAPTPAPVEQLQLVEQLQPTPAPVEQLQAQADQLQAQAPEISGQVQAQAPAPAPADQLQAPADQLQAQAPASAEQAPRCDPGIVTDYCSLPILVISNDQAPAPAAPMSERDKAYSRARTR